jgi:hypothetical protein
MFRPLPGLRQRGTPTKDKVMAHCVKDVQKWGLNKMFSVKIYTQLYIYILKIYTLAKRTLLKGEIAS